MPLSAARAADTDPQPVALFSIQAQAEPGVMPRVLELFAKRGLVPTVWHSKIGGADRAKLSIEIEMSGLAGETVRYIAACLRQIVCVETVLTAEPPMAS